MDWSDPKLQHEQDFLKVKPDWRGLLLFEGILLLSLALALWVCW